MIALVMSYYSDFFLGGLASVGATIFTNPLEVRAFHLPLFHKELKYYLLLTKGYQDTHAVTR